MSYIVLNFLELCLVFYFLENAVDKTSAVGGTSLRHVIAFFGNS